MNWSAPRYDLNPQVVPFESFNNVVLTNEVKNKILSRLDYTCRYCGGKYSKYMHFVLIEDEYEICCRPCFLITHLNYGNYKEIKLYYSELSQLDIVKKTIEYILKFDKPPTPLDLDKDLKKAPLSLFEFINILNYDYNNNNFKNFFDKYKIFFSQKFDTSFIFGNFGIQTSLFIEEEEDSQGFTDTDTNNDINIPEHELTPEEEDALNNIF